MKTRCLLIVVGLLLFVPISANACWTCYVFCTTAGNGSCKCTSFGPGACTFCGECVGGRCTINCPQPGGHKLSPQGVTLLKAWREWPWLNDPDLVQNIGAVSPVLGKLMQYEQMFMRSKEGAGYVACARGGSFSLSPHPTRSKPGHVVLWYSVVSGNKIRYLVYQGYGNQPRELVITADRWQVLQHKRVVAEGTFVVWQVE